MAKDSTKYTISQVYDIAKAIISDPAFNCSKYQDKYTTTYNFRKDGLYMNICAPHGGREWDGDYDKWDYREGSITIKDGISTMYARTKHNVGRAMNRLCINPIAAFTRLRAPLFFNLINMAEKRGLDQTEVIKHKIKTLRMKTL